MINIGEKLPSFSLAGINEFGEEKIYTNKDFLGKLLVIYFYPKDDTPGCTKESCNFNLMLPKIQTKASIVGISADNIESHKKFQTKFHLNFPLLSDTDFSFIKLVGAYKEDILAKLLSYKVKRTTFLISSTGELIKIWSNVNVENHDQEVLDQINQYA